MWEILQDKPTPADYVDTIERGVNMGKVSGQAFKDEFSFGYQIGGFATIPSGTVSLVAPTRFNKSQMGELKGQELDLMLLDPECILWLGESG